MNSKILKLPIFKDLPKTNLANVQENIQNWIAKGNTTMINTFCVIDSTKSTGYRFITSAELEETTQIDQIISGLHFCITYTRRVHTPDHFCPLWFEEWYKIITLRYENITFEFKSDNDLKKKIKQIKSNICLK